MTDTERRYDIDWLRVIAIALLLLYHITIAFQPWGVFIGFIQNTDPLERLWIPMSMLNVWRIPLLFYVSGMGVGFAINKRNWKQLIGERSRRILLPFLFGMVAIVPFHMLLWQKYYSQDLHYTIHPSHLWFLANIFIYVLILSPFFFYLKNNRSGKLIRFFEKLFSHPLGIILTVIPFIIEVLIVKPDSFETYAFTLHGFIIGLLAFLFGFVFIFSRSSYWQIVRKWKWLFLALASLLYTVRLLVFDLAAPFYLTAIESNLWIFAAFGIANTYLNRPGKTLSYISQAAYPIYILHMFFLFLGSALLFPLDISALLKFILLLVFTVTACFGSYEFIIRRVFFFRPLFGLKRKT